MPSSQWTPSSTAYDYPHHPTITMLNREPTSAVLLDPLQGLPIPPPFEESSQPFPAMSPFASPDPDATPRLFPTPLPSLEDFESFVPPPAPATKDLDSFSDGTASGSFADFEYAHAPALELEDLEPLAYNHNHPHPDSIESWRDDVQRHASTRYDLAVELGRRRLPTPPPEEPANKRRRVSELPRVDGTFDFGIGVYRPEPVRVGLPQPDPQPAPPMPNALGIELYPQSPRFAIVRAASAPPTFPP